MFLLIPVSYASRKGAMTHLKEQKAFGLFSSRECYKLINVLKKQWTSLALRTGLALLTQCTSASRLWTKSRHSIALLYANPRTCLNSGDKVLGKSVGRQHHTEIMQKLCPRLVLHGQMIKTARNKKCTFTYKKRKKSTRYNRQGVG